MNLATASSPQACLNCGNRTKQVRHGLAWCLVDDTLVILAAPRECRSFEIRTGDLPDASPEVLAQVAGKWTKPSRLRKKCRR